MTTERVLEVAIVCCLFLGYSVLWAVKRRSQTRRTGVDPHVVAGTETPVQLYFGRLLRFLTVAVIGLILLHAMAPPAWGAVTQLTALNTRAFNLFGAILGAGGLCLCLIAQIAMGDSWRVGIDARHSTPLVEQGVFRWCRNPTYVGLFTLNLGVWLVWPTTAMGAYSILFFVILEIQVRCEEEHLERLHGSAYGDYKGRTWRYLPWLY